MKYMLHLGAGLLLSLSVVVFLAGLLRRGIPNVSGSPAAPPFAAFYGNVGQVESRSQKK